MTFFAMQVLVIRLVQKNDVFFINIKVERNKKNE